MIPARVVSWRAGFARSCRGGRRVEPFGRLGNHRFFLLHCGVPGNKSGWICCKVGREQGRSWGLQRDMPKDRHGNTCVLWSCGEIRPARRDQEQQAPRKVRLPNVLFALAFRRRAAICWLVNICRLELLHRVVKNGGFAAATRHSSYGIQRVRRSVSWRWTIFPRPLSACHGRPSHPGSQSLFEHRVAGSSETTRGNASTCGRPAAEFGRNSDALLNRIQRRNPLAKFTLFLPYRSASAACRSAPPPLKSLGNALFSSGKRGYF